jgi:hypothetical protein
VALIAKEVLRIGFTVVALPGTVVSPEAVKEYGWGDKVEDNGKPLDPDADTATKSTAKKK